MGKFLASGSFAALTVGLFASFCALLSLVLWLSPEAEVESSSGALTCSARERSALRCPLCFDLLRAQGTWTCTECHAQAHDACVAELGPCHEQTKATSPAPQRRGWAHLEDTLAAPSQLYTPVGPTLALPSSTQPADICALVEPAAEPESELSVLPREPRVEGPSPRRGSWLQLEQAVNSLHRSRA